MATKLTKLDAGWYRFTIDDAVYEIESVKRMGGGGDPHEWLCYLAHEGKPREWFATVDRQRDAVWECRANHLWTKGVAKAL